jgi:hypothetical protein
MKTSALIFLFCIVAFSAKATECTLREFIHPHIHFTLCQNYSNYSEIRTLHFQHSISLLEKWWTQSVPLSKRGKVKFNIELLDDILTWNHLQIERFGDSCAIRVSGFVTIEQLAAYMNYCVSPTFQPMLFNKSLSRKSGDSLRNAQETALRRFYSPALKKFSDANKELWRGDIYSLRYGGDTLWYACNDAVLRVKPTSTLPYKVKDRWLFFEPERFIVIKGCNVLMEEKLKEDFVQYNDYRIKELNGDVSIEYGNELHYYLYNYAENSFTEVRKNPEQR